MYFNPKHHPLSPRSDAPASHRARSFLAGGATISSGDRLEGVGARHPEAQHGAAVSAPFPESINGKSRQLEWSVAAGGQEKEGSGARPLATHFSFAVPVHVH